MTLLLFIAVGIMFIYLVRLNGRLKQLEQRGAAFAPSPAPPASTAPAKLSANQRLSLAPDREVHHLDSKSFINALPKIGIAALVIGLGFFLKYAIDQGWVSVNLRLLVGAVIGALFMILYYLWHEKYPRYALALAGGGLAIWYLTVFAAVKMYSLLSINTGLVILIAVSLFGLWLAYITRSYILASVAWGTAYLAPIVLGVSSEHHALVLWYVMLLSTALAITAFYTRTRYLLAVLLMGTASNLLAAHASVAHTPTYYAHTIIVLFLSLCLLTATAASMLRQSADQKLDERGERDYILLAILGYVFFALPLLILQYEHFRDYSALAAAGLGVWTFVVYAVVDRLEYTRLNYVMSLFGSALLALGVFWHFDRQPEIAMLYLLGVAGVVVGVIQKRVEIRVWGLVVVLVGIAAALTLSYEKTSSLLFNAKFGLEALGLLALAVVYGVIRRDGLTEFEKNLHEGLAYIIAGLLWWFVSWDLFNYFNDGLRENQRNLSLSMWWLIYGVILMATSGIPVLRPLRKVALILFGLVIAKVFLYDVRALDMVYRIVAFISLGVILLIVSFIYQHNKEKIKEYLQS